MKNRSRFSLGSNKILSRNTKHNNKAQRRHALFTEKQYAKFISQFCKDNDDNLLDFNSFSSLFLSSVNENPGLVLFLEKQQYSKKDEIEINNVLDSNTKLGNPNLGKKLLYAAVYAYTTYCVLNGISGLGVNAEIVQFNKNGLLIIPPHDERKSKIDDVAYSKNECDKMLKKPPNVLFYSKGCENWNGHGSVRKFSNIEPKTLNKLVKKADEYWCQDTNCKLDTKQDANHNMRVEVCTMTNLQDGDLGDSIRFSPNNPYGVRNNDDRSYRSIRLSADKIKMTQEKDGTLSFDPEKGADGSVSKELPENTFIHEVGHAVFGLNHPKEPNSIMHAQTSNPKKIKSIKKDDKTFVEKCVGRKNGGRGRDDL